MNTKAIIYLFTLLSLFVLGTCSSKKPTDVDSACQYKIVVTDSTNILSVDSTLGYAPVADALVRLHSVDYDKTFSDSTDENGVVSFDELIASQYRIDVTKLLSAEFMASLGYPYNDVMLSHSWEENIFQNKVTETDTVSLEKNIVPQIVINEIYYAGPPGVRYYDDQYIELYNPTGDTQYLDKLIIIRITEYNSEFIIASDAFQFSGNGQDYPIESGKFIVIAQKAHDHSQYGGGPDSPDLSDADWEFCSLCNDVCNESVPGLEEIDQNICGDFRLNLMHNGVALIKAKELNELRYDGDGRIVFEFTDVMDGVEYYKNSLAVKVVNNIIDAGAAGIDLQQYSGMSIERQNPLTKEPGYDSNNSTSDFVIIKNPTPDYQHAPDDIVNPML